MLKLCVRRHCFEYRRSVFILVSYGMNFSYFAESYTLKYPRTKTMILVCITSLVSDFHILRIVNFIVNQEITQLNVRTFTVSSTENIFGSV